MILDTPPQEPNGLIRDGAGNKSISVFYWAKMATTVRPFRQHRGRRAV